MRDIPRVLNIRMRDIPSVLNIRMRDIPRVLKINENDSTNSSKKFIITSKPFIYTRFTIFLIKLTTENIM